MMKMYRFLLLKSEVLFSFLVLCHSRWSTWVVVFFPFYCESLHLVFISSFWFCAHIKCPHLVFFKVGGYFDLSTIYHSELARKGTMSQWVLAISHPVSEKLCLVCGSHPGLFPNAQFSSLCKVCVLKKPTINIHTTKPIRYFNWVF